MKKVRMMIVLITTFYVLILFLVLGFIEELIQVPSKKYRETHNE